MLNGSSTKYIACLLLAIALTSCTTTTKGVKQSSDIPEECLARCRMPLAGEVSSVEQMDRIDAYNAEVHGECIQRHHCLIRHVKARQ